MHHGLQRERGGPAGDGPVAVSRFAAEIVARLTARDGATQAPVREDLVRRLLAAVRSVDRAPFEALKPELRRARVSRVALAELYIPEVARRLGQGWHDDTCTFAEVTIGTARLQAILRDIATSWSADESGRNDGLTVLVLLPPGEQHTLGAMVAVAKLRRMGVSVCLRIGTGPAELRELFVKRAFDAIMISIAHAEMLEVCSKLVKTLKDMTGHKVPVAVGGALFLEGSAPMSVPEADIVTNDIETALQAFGLGVSRRRPQLGQA
ncbi:cobalamin B12-binding domain-containing protein [Rhodobacter sp. NSM]|uniref:cobalamin B12-binding domain-containing protein n=1 Tax=Rhodobacter sp. NSM TaxID=3457501 RepID=UPI003FD2C56A